MSHAVELNSVSIAQVFVHPNRLEQTKNTQRYKRPHRDNTDAQTIELADQLKLEIL